MRGGKQVPYGESDELVLFQKCVRYKIDTFDKFNFNLLTKKHCSIRYNEEYYENPTIFGQETLALFRWKNLENKQNECLKLNKTFVVSW